MILIWILPAPKNDQRMPQQPYTLAFTNDTHLNEDGFIFLLRQGPYWLVEDTIST